MSKDRVCEMLSGVESLSSSPSPPPVSLSLSSCLSLPLPSSCSSLSSSRQVTARLYSSLQQSREQESRFHTCARPPASRQVSFNFAAPAVTMATSPPVALSDLQDLELGLDACTTNHVVTCDREGAESAVDPRAGGDMMQNLQSSAKASAGRRHIEEMENVRTHLQTMLRASPRSTDAHELLPPALHHLQDNSYESDATSHLLGGVEELFPRYSRLRGDFDSAPFYSVSELQVMKESLERERARRKHSEQQLMALQNKTLALQQQLALAVSADRKKDIMIEQLDKTLEKVVEGWRRHEREKSEGVRRLQEEKEAAEGAQENQRQVLVGLETSLSEAAEALDMEKKRNEDLHNTNAQLERDLAALRVCNGQLQQQEALLRAQAEETKAEASRLQTLVHSLQDQLQQHDQQATHTHTQLQHNITQLTQQLENERERVKHSEDLQARLQQLQQDLDETRRERDAGRVERALDQARFEAQRSQWEVELRLSVEQQVTQRLTPIQEENTTTNTKLREQHRKQLLDLSARYERDLSVQKEELREQLQERDERMHQHTLDCNKRIAELQDQLVSMETSKRKLEMQREELVSRLQGMMRSHWTEALKLLSNLEQNEALLSPSTLWDKAHTNPPDTSNTHTTAAPQAVVLHTWRERDLRDLKDLKESKVEGGRVEADYSLLNHSHMFTPLEPVLDDTHLTAGGGSDVTDLWDRGLGGGERQTFERGSETEGETGLAVRDGYWNMNQIRSHNHSRTSRQAMPRTNHIHSFPELLPNQNCTSERGAGNCNVPMEKLKAPPTPEQPLSITERAPPTATNSSSFCEERQSELQYYITKLLERSPGDPLEEQEVDQRKNREEPRPGSSGVGSQTESRLEQLSDLLGQSFPPVQAEQHLQQLLHGLLRSGESGADLVRINLDRRLAQQGKREQRPPASRSTQSSSSRGRRSALSGQRPGSRGGVWK